MDSLIRNISMILCAGIALASCHQEKGSMQEPSEVPESKTIEISKFVVDSLFDIELVHIPSGKLESEPDYLRRHAALTHIEDFYIGKYEITQKQWKEVMGTYPPPFDWQDFTSETALMDKSILARRKEISKTEFFGDDLPAVVLSWEAAYAFVLKLSEKTGHLYRLPSDEEWGYAYRAGTSTDYYFGNDTLLVAEYEWYNENSDGRIHPVGQKKPNPWGLYDMGGNAAEWTETIADLTSYTRKYGRQFDKGTNRDTGGATICTPSLQRTPPGHTPICKCILARMWGFVW